jgi:hypothetical protein
VFEKRVLRRIFGPQRGNVTGRWRKLIQDVAEKRAIIKIINSNTVFTKL